MQLGPHPVTLRQLQYLVAVADQRSFRKAAEACHVSQPSLSAQVAQAEEALGVQLFERNQRRVALTPAGAELMLRIRGLLNSADALVDAAARLRDPFSGALRLGLIPTVGPYLLPEIALPLRTKYPELTFLWTELQTAPLLRALSQGEVDGAILALVDEVLDYPRIDLGLDPFVLATPRDHRLGQSRRPIKASELQGEHVLLLEDGHCFRDQALDLCARTGAEEASYRATSLPTLVQMAAGGVGITLLPAISLPVENRHHSLQIRSFAPKPPTRTLSLVWRRGSAREVALTSVGEALKSAYATFMKSVRTFISAEPT